MIARLSLFAALLLSVDAASSFAQLSYKTISGYVRSGGIGLSGVTLSGFPTPPTTDSRGYYSTSVPVYVGGSAVFGWSGTVLPAKPGYVFVPDSIVYSNVTTNLTNQNYAASIETFSIYGYVRTSAKVAISGVLMNGLPGNPITDSRGYYAATVPYGWDGTSQPTKAGGTFSPTVTSYKYVTANQRDDYTGSIQVFTISGYVRNRSGTGVAGVNMSGLPAYPATDEKGFYTGTVEYGWGGTVTPTKSGYNFGDKETSYKSVTSDQRTDYTASLQVFVISGFVRTAAGTGIAGVALNGLPGNPTTDGTGFYLVGVDYGWSGIVVPSKIGVLFSASTVSYSNVTANQSTNYTGTSLTFVISGFVKTSALDPMTGVVLNGLPSLPVTNGVGFYSDTVAYGWQGTVAPSKSGYSFTPVSTAYSNVSTSYANQNYSGVSQQGCTISGYVRTAAGSPIIGVVLAGLPSAPLTDANGFYSAVVGFGWQGTVTPTKANFSFAPPTRDYDGVTTDQTNQNYVGASQLGYELSGYVRTATGGPVSGVVLTGLPSTPTTDTNGFYSDAVSYGWHGTVVPTKGGYSFTPSSLTYAEVMSSQTNQNYVGTSLQGLVISGFARTSAGAAISGVSLVGLPDGTITDVNGFYSCFVNSGWSGSVTPARDGYIFSPAFLLYNSLTSDQSNQNYVGVVAAYSISGHIRTSAGAGIAEVVINGLPGTPTTDATGYYAGSVNSGWSGTVTPLKTGFNFNPQSSTYANVTSDRTTDYVGIQQQTYTISGYVRNGAGAGLNNVIMTGLPASPGTNANGFYSSTVASGWSGTVTPTRSGFSFLPSFIALNNVTSNHANQNFTGAIQQLFVISGYVRNSGGTGISGVAMAGLPTSPATSADGYYADSVIAGWSGTVTPTKSGYTFSPTGTAYGGVAANLEGNYTGTTLQKHLISGSVRNQAGEGIIGVAMVGLPSNPVCDGDGCYAAAVGSGWSGTVTPTKAGYSFTPASTTYSYVSFSLTGDYTGTPTTDVEERPGGIPNEFSLHQNFPNPFNPSTRIRFGLPKAASVRLSIMDVLGREVAELVRGERSAGVHEMTWDASQLPGGIYFCRIVAGELLQTRKMILLK